MTLFLLSGDRYNLNLRYLPLMVWLFVGLVIYGVVDIVTRMVDGRAPADIGGLTALALLISLGLFALHKGGEMVLASFDRGGDLIRIQRYGMTGRVVLERPFSELVAMDVRVLRRSQHRVELRFRSGERLPLTPYYVVTFNSGGLNRLASLLEVEPTLIAPVKR
ncbi:hypothetical protein [Candidatus Chloroploca asiatica]|uniref:DUF304 domain-containing protein n=1 Tax=Candidatus Chloroploca asiatica TaxID=1506545 RepID=A0A2H3KYY0_9CHLR|nr:hypothetical protein [Candidatus Chloroploca asiatica]PDV97566.1 hypothetical protein A9Q02_03680 [Candidatus Chloroploca asiatica]